MSDSITEDKIDLLLEQIKSIEESGFYTEKEMDKKTYPLRQELESLLKQDSLQNHNKSVMTYALAIFENKKPTE